MSHDADITALEQAAMNSDDEREGEEHSNLDDPISGAEVEGDSAEGNGLDGLLATKDVVTPTPFVLDTKAADDARARDLQARRLAIQTSIDRTLRRQKQFDQEELELQKLQTKLNDLNRGAGSATARDAALDVTPDDGGHSKLRFKRKIDSDFQDHRSRDNEHRQLPLLSTDDKANPTVRGIQQLRRNSIQTIRDISDVLRHIIKNVSELERLVRNIANLGHVTQREFFGKVFLKREEEGSDGERD
jgi:hypothetical protein